jgi:hypothetical protein
MSSTDKDPRLAQIRELEAKGADGDKRAYGKAREIKVQMMMETLTGHRDPTNGRAIPKDDTGNEPPTQLGSPGGVVIGPGGDDD